jgi:hypothetical protein
MILLQILHDSASSFPLVEKIPADALQDLSQRGLLLSQGGRYRLSLQALHSLGNLASLEREQLAELLFFLQQLYQKKRTLRTQSDFVATQLQRPLQDVSRQLAYLSELSVFIKPSFAPETGFVSDFALSDVVLAVSLWDSPSLPAVSGAWSVRSFSIDGYKPFLRTQIPMSPLTALLGPSGSGKTCFIAALKFLRYAILNPLPPSIDPWWEGRKIFTTSNPEAVRLEVEISVSEKTTLRYEVEIHGEGPPKIFREKCILFDGDEVFHLLSVTVGRGVFFSPTQNASQALPFLTKQNELWLSQVQALQNPWLTMLRDFISGCKAYFSIDPMLSSYESYLIKMLDTYSEEQSQELQRSLRESIENFDYFSIKRGEAFVGYLLCKEKSMREETLWVDTAESFRRLFALAVLAHAPSTSIICLDTPLRGISPELWPAAWRFIEKISQRSQLILSLDGPQMPLQNKAQLVSLSTKTGRPLAKNETP